MAQQNNANNNIVTQQQHQQLVKPVFHDFLGTKNSNPVHSNVLYAPKTPHLYVTASSLSSTTVLSSAAGSDLASGELVPPPFASKLDLFFSSRKPHVLHFHGSSLDFSVEATCSIVTLVSRVCFHFTLVLFSTLSLGKKNIFLVRT